ncbi:MAG: beta-ketoacyl-ACP synthase 3 [Myxococcales bacterium]|nr:beta-ketoacyl-ACP synthase 3 [Myxococcales bacterium]
MPNAYISGTGFHVPEDVVSNDELAKRYGIETSDEWIEKRTGIEARRFAPAGVGTSDLAVPAVEMALGRAGLAKTDIGMIIFATLSPDHAFPGSGVYLQTKLGLTDDGVGHFVGCLDVRNQCSGFLYGLATAASMVQSGSVDNVVVVGAEVHSAALDLSTAGRDVASLFGDGAGAVIVSATDEDRGVRGWHLGADGRHADALSQKIWDISKRPFIPQNEEGVGQVDPAHMFARMAGRLVFKNAVERMIGALMKEFQKQSLTLNDVDLFFFHQANLRINQYVATQLGIPEDKLFHNIERYGNTTAATIPIMLAEAQGEGRLERGMKIATVAFGSGFTWGAAIIEW